jgi:hypothetical protein
MFPFDKLNRKLARADRVPLIADMMPTRGTYEALMVNSSPAMNTAVGFSAEAQMSVSDFNTVLQDSPGKTCAEQFCATVTGAMTPEQERSCSCHK